MFPGHLSGYARVTFRNHGLLKGEFVSPGRLKTFFFALAKLEHALIDFGDSETFEMLSAF